MKFNSKFITLIMSCALGISCACAASQPMLKVYRSIPDTVYSENQLLICVTNPGATATVQGKKMHVYDTGSFGTRVKLKNGENSVKIVVKNKSAEADTTLHVFLAAPSEKKNVPAKETVYTLSPVDAYFVSLPGAYMQFGDGNDRLGGSKMGFVDAGIVFHVVGEIGDLYKVQLSQNRFAYIEKHYLEKSELTTQQVNTGSWSIRNVGKADKINISLPVKLPYYSWTQLDPTTICVDIFGATNNSNWMTQHGKLEMIDYVDFRHDESDVFRVIIKLKKKYAWGYSVHYEGNSLAIEVRHTPQLTLKNMVIGLDAGHGGEYPGAVSPSGITEKYVNLEIIKELKSLLKKRGAKVVMSRDGDTGPSMTERKRIFREANVDMMLSVHNNAGADPLSEAGTSVYYRQIVNRELAVIMHDTMLELGVKDFGLTGNFNFSLNGPTEYPNVLLEVLFMSSLPEEEKLASPAFRKEVAMKIVEGLEKYLAKVAAQE